MKALGLTLMDNIMRLNQLDIISNDERVEYARIIQAAMLPGNENFYDILREKLATKTAQATDLEYDYLSDVLCLIPYSAN